MMTTSWVVGSCPGDDIDHCSMCRKEGGGGPAATTSWYPLVGGCLHTGSFQCDMDLVALTSFDQQGDAGQSGEDSGGGGRLTL